MIKAALMADAVVKFIMAALSFFGSAGFSFLYWDRLAAYAIVVAVVLLAVAVALVWLAIRPQRVLIQIMLVLNLLGGIAALAALVFLNLETTGNRWAVLLTGIALLALAALEWQGLRRSQSGPPEIRASPADIRVR